VLLVARHGLGELHAGEGDGADQGERRRRDRARRHRGPSRAPRPHFRDDRRPPGARTCDRRAAAPAARRRAAGGYGAMKVLILGAGAMGCLYGAAFHRAGADVTFVDVNRAHIDAINTRGLELETRAGTELLPIPACLPEEVAEPADL